MPKFGAKGVGASISAGPYFIPLPFCLSQAERQRDFK